MNRSNLDEGVFAEIHKAAGCDVYTETVEVRNPPVVKTGDGPFLGLVYRRVCYKHGVASELFTTYSGSNLPFSEK